MVWMTLAKFLMLEPILRHIYNKQRGAEQAVIILLLWPVLDDNNYYVILRWTVVCIKHAYDCNNIIMHV